MEKIKNTINVKLEEIDQIMAAYGDEYEDFARLAPFAQTFVLETVAFEDEGYGMEDFAIAVGYFSRLLLGYEKARTELNN